LLGVLLYGYVSHAFSATLHEANYEQAYAERDKIPPGLNLVHDQGIYLMSNGFPALPQGENVVYAEGCEPDPERNPDWWDHCRELVGGDDFVDYLPAKLFIGLGRGRAAAGRVVEIEVRPTEWGISVVGKPRKL
jgi:hypothetical protein